MQICLTYELGFRYADLGLQECQSVFDVIKGLACIKLELLQRCVGDRV